MVSDTALRTKLRKDKLLSQNSIITSAISSELSTGTLPVAPAGSPLAKVQGRLLSSKLIASEILTVVETLRGVLEPKPKDATLHESDLEDGSEESPPQKVPKTRTNDTTQAYGDMDDESVDDEDSEEVDDGGWESGSVHSAEEDERSLETSSDIETGDQSNTKPTNPRPAQIQRNQTSVGKDRMNGSATAGQSTFIPSLAVGYTRGDSDASDISDGEAETASGDLKKNRRGQRARRA